MLATETTLEGKKMTEQATKLVATGSDGNFVRESQELADKQGFKFVSKTWYNKTMPIEDAIAKVSAGVAQREDIIVPFSEVKPRIDGNLDLVMEFADGREYKPTDHALRQYLGRIHVPYTYVGNVLNHTHYQSDEKDYMLMLKLLLNGHRHVEGKKKFRFRTYKDGTLRAVLTTDYSPVDNVWYLEQLKKLMPGCRASHWRGDADTIYGNILIPDTIREEQDSDYGGLVAASNCEIGKRRLDQEPSVFRAICMNGCIWGRKRGLGISRVHRGIDMVQLKEQIRDNIHNQIPLMGNLIDKFLELQKVSMKVPGVKMSRVFGVVSLDYELSMKEANEVLGSYAQFERDHKSAFGVVNAFTRAGQLFDNDNWVRFDNIGGELATLDDKGWDKIITRAKNFDDAMMEKVFGTAGKV
jgi:hypothetical protein